MTTTLQTKPAKTSAKTGTKPAAARKTSTAKTFSLIAYIAAGIASRLEKPYYKTALAYHKRRATVFPRARLDAVRAKLTREDADAVFAKHDKGLLPAADQIGQACFDVYMMSLK